MKTSNTKVKSKSAEKHLRKPTPKTQTKSSPKFAPKPELLNTIMNYILLFLVCAFIGWIWEVILTFIKTGSLVNRGVLYGPWLPLYGFGGVLMAFLLHGFDRHPVVVFLASATICGLLEYFTGWFLETFHHLKWWDYSDLAFNLNGRICLLSVTAFGLCGLLMIYVLKPITFHTFDRISPALKTVICLVFLACIISDAVYASDRPNTGEGITNPLEQVFQK